MTGFDVKRFDIYRKVPKDLTQPTLTGAIISILCVTSISILIISELSRYLTTELISTVYVDNPGNEERIPVEISVKLPKLKCEFVGLDIQDDMGRHEVGFVENTEKIEIENDEGCLFNAKFFINKIPGNFHVSTHSAHNHPDNPDFTHTINSVRFGENLKINHKSDIPGTYNSLQNVTKAPEYGIESHDYIMKIVPTVYEQRNGKSVISYQYTFVYRTFIGRGTPALWFKYDISPLTVKYTEKGESIFSFLTAICAVVGGVFTVAGILDGLIFTASSLYQKFELGKLG